MSLLDSVNEIYIRSVEQLDMIVKLVDVLGSASNHYGSIITVLITACLLYFFQSYIYDYALLLWNLSH